MNEPCHDKTNIMGLRSAWIQTSLRFRAADQDPCCSLSVSLLVIGFTWILIRLRGCQQFFKAIFYKNIHMIHLFCFHQYLKPVQCTVSNLLLH
jgi:hypothetical protein